MTIIYHLFCTTQVSQIQCEHYNLRFLSLHVIKKLLRHKINLKAHNLQCSSLFQLSLTKRIPKEKQLPLQLKLSLHRDLVPCKFDWILRLFQRHQRYHIDGLMQKKINPVKIVKCTVALYGFSCNGQHVALVNLCLVKSVDLSLPN